MMSATDSVRRSDCPLVSFVIATFNDFDDLRGAITLARAQTWNNLEIIVVDDASTEAVDPKLRALGEIADGLKVVRRDSNGGVFAALQSGIEEARGEYIYLGSTNDPVEPNFIKASVDVLERFPLVAICFSDPGIIIGWNGERRSFPLFLAPETKGFGPAELADRMYRVPFHIPSNTVVFRTQALRRVGGCRTTLGPYADWFACLVAALSDGAAYIPQVLAYSRVHPNAFSDINRWDYPARLAAARATLNAIAAHASDTALCIRRSMEVSNFGLRVLIGLLQDPVCRSLIAPRALWIAFLRDSWAGIRLLVPDAGRNWVRRAAIGLRQ